MVSRKFTVSPRSVPVALPREAEKVSQVIGFRPIFATYTDPSDVQKTIRAASVALAAFVGRSRFLETTSASGSVKVYALPETEGFGLGPSLRGTLTPALLWIAGHGNLKKLLDAAIAIYDNPNFDNIVASTYPLEFLYRHPGGSLRIASVSGRAARHPVMIIQEQDFLAAFSVAPPKLGHPMMEYTSRGDRYWPTDGREVDWPDIGFSDRPNAPILDVGYFLFPITEEIWNLIRSDSMNVMIAHGRYIRAHSLRVDPEIAAYAAPRKGSVIIPMVVKGSSPSSGTAKEVETRTFEQIFNEPSIGIIASAAHDTSYDSWAVVEASNGVALLVPRNHSALVDQLRADGDQKLESGEVIGFQVKWETDPYGPSVIGGVRREFMGNEKFLKAYAFFSAFKPTATVALKQPGSSSNVAITAPFLRDYNDTVSFPEGRRMVDPRAVGGEISMNVISTGTGAKILVRYMVPSKGRDAHVQMIPPIVPYLVERYLISRGILGDATQRRSSQIISSYQFSVPENYNGRFPLLPESLATSLWTTTKVLWWLTNEPWKVVTIPKSNGGYRIIEIPTKALARILRDLNSALSVFDDLLPESVVGFRLGGAPWKLSAKVLAYMREVEDPAVIRIDLKDFFHQIRIPKIVAALTKEKLPNGLGPLIPSKRLAFLIASLATNHGRLPQGSPLSPRMSNLVFMEVDFALDRYTKRAGARYARYADDIVVVAPKEKAKAILDGVLRIITRHGYKVNRKKIAIQSPDDARIVGLTVGPKGVTVPKQVYRTARLVNHLHAQGADFLKIFKRNDELDLHHLRHFIGELSYYVSALKRIQESGEPIRKDRLKEIGKAKEILVKELRRVIPPVHPS